MPAHSGGIAIAAPSPEPKRLSSSPGGGAQQTTSGIVALIFGILQFVALPVIGAIVALVAGYNSRNEARRNPAVSDDLGRIGRILGWVGLALTLAGILLVVLFVLAVGGLAFMGFVAVPLGM